MVYNLLLLKALVAHNGLGWNNTYTTFYNRRRLQQWYLSIKTFYSCLPSLYATRMTRRTDEGQNDLVYLIQILQFPHKHFPGTNHHYPALIHAHVWQLSCQLIYPFLQMKVHLLKSVCAKEFLLEVQVIMRQGFHTKTIKKNIISKFIIFKKSGINAKKK